MYLKMIEFQEITKRAFVLVLLVLWRFSKSKYISEMGEKNAKIIICRPCKDSLAL